MNDLVWDPHRSVSALITILSFNGSRVLHSSMGESHHVHVTHSHTVGTLSLDKLSGRTPKPTDDLKLLRTVERRVI